MWGAHLEARRVASERHRTEVRPQAPDPRHAEIWDLESFFTSFFVRRRIVPTAPAAFAGTWTIRLVVLKNDLLTACPACFAEAPSGPDGVSAQTALRSSCICGVIMEITWTIG